MALHLIIIPSLKQVEVNIELVEDPGDGLVDHIVEGLRKVVEGWDRRKDDRAHARQRNHTFQMAQMKGGLAREQDKLLSFLEHHIGCPDS